jgi:hypothetical protein
VTTDLKAGDAMTAAERCAKLTGRFVTPRRRPGACLSTLLHDEAPFALMQRCHTWSIEFQVGHGGTR